MHDAGVFRGRLAARILGLLGAASLAAPACNGAKGGAGGGPGAAMTTGTAPLDAGTGGAGGTSGSGGTSGAGGAASGGGGAGGQLTDPLVESCFDPVWLLPDAGADAGSPALDAGGPSCPTDPGVALSVFQNENCPNGWEPYDITSGPIANSTGECCYMGYITLCGPGGRPYLAGADPGASPDHHAIVATAERGADTRGWVEDGRPMVAGLRPAERRALAEAWTRDALAEHASVASFARFSLSLLAVGAPSDLVEQAHRAALDEVRHARLCFALASAYAGEVIAPGPFPIGEEVAVGASLASIAVSTFEEGCIGETVAAVVAAEQLARATDPAVRAALLQIAEDEARHAELAWRAVAWAAVAGGSAVHEAVQQALGDAILQAATAFRGEGAAPAPSALSAHGRLDAVTTANVVARAMVDIVVPTVRRLLAVGAPLA